MEPFKKRNYRTFPPGAAPDVFPSDAGSNALSQTMGHNAFRRAGLPFASLVSTLKLAHPQERPYTIDICPKESFEGAA